MKITYKQISGNFSRIQMFIDGKSFGDILDDNSYIEDGFRFHDLYHITLFLLFDFDKGVYGTLIGDNKPNHNLNKLEESLVLFMFTLGKNHSIDNPNKILFDTIIDIMQNKMLLKVDEEILLKYVFYMYDLIKSIVSNNTSIIELTLNKEKLKNDLGL